MRGQLRAAPAARHAAGNWANAAARCCSSPRGLPAMRTVLSRLLAPPTIEMSRRGNRHAFARTAISASFARFSAGGAVTATFRTARPSAENATPSMRSARARGVRRMATRTPSAAALRGRSLEEARGKVVDEQAPQKHQDQDQDDRRDVDTAEIRQERPDRAQRRLGYAIEKIADDRNAAVVAVDHAKGQQPAQHRLRDQQPNVDVDQRIDEPDQPSHTANPRPPTARATSWRAA